MDVNACLKKHKLDILTGLGILFLYALKDIWAGACYWYGSAGLYLKLFSNGCIIIAPFIGIPFIWIYNIRGIKKYGYSLKDYGGILIYGMAVFGTIVFISIGCVFAEYLGADLPGVIADIKQQPITKSVFLSGVRTVTSGSGRHSATVGFICFTDDDGKTIKVPFSDNESLRTADCQKLINISNNHNGICEVPVSLTYFPHTKTVEKVTLK
ncbi:hypothetical protein [Pectinatus frisingensis]|uniref:hypothetical protein n=1 Tax=Pectinatus frisingensis TaxID=865 RepID=UPI0018C50C7D|nr:hypothetical protein [Pectinatus frisingensis]